MLMIDLVTLLNKSYNLIPYLRIKYKAQLFYLFSGGSCAFLCLYFKIADNYVIKK